MVGIVPIEGDAHDSGDWEDPTNGPLGELFEAVEAGDVSHVEELLKEVPASSIDTIGPEGDTLLHLACLYGHEDTVRLLVQHGASTAIVDEDNGTVLHDAAACGNMAIVRMITDANPGLVLVADADGDTALHNACRGGHAEVVRHLLSLGAAKDALNRAGQTPRGASGDEIDPEVADALTAADG